MIGRILGQFGRWLSGGITIVHIGGDVINGKRAPLQMESARPADPSPGVRRRPLQILLGMPHKPEAIAAPSALASFGGSQPNQQHGKGWNQIMRNIEGKRS